MRHPGVLLMVLMLIVGGAASGLDAQTTRSTREATRVIGGVGWVSLWDDETFLGRGALVSGGVAQPFGEHAVVEGELAWATHHRDSGYLVAEGRALVGTARLSYAFRSRDRGARLFLRALASPSSTRRGA